MAGFMRIQLPLTEAHRASGGKLIFTAAAALIFFGLLVFGTPHTESAPAFPQTPRLPTSQPAGLRQDTDLPSCTAQQAVRGVQGQLVRTQSARIIGLTDIHEVNDDQRWGRICQAKVNLDFGTQPIIYTIRRVANAPNTWELVVTAH
jgi:hypothetical protein